MKTDELLRPENIVKHDIVFHYVQLVSRSIFHGIPPPKKKKSTFSRRIFHRIYHSTQQIPRELLPEIFPDGINKTKP